MADLEPPLPPNLESSHRGAGDAFDSGRWDYRDYGRGARGSLRLFLESTVAYKPRHSLRVICAKGSR